jgi:Bacterial dnaA  protein
VGKESVPNPIRTPELERMVAVLQKRAEQMKVTLPKDVALYLAQNVRSSTRALEGALLRLIAHSSLTGTKITLTYAQRVLKYFIDRQAGIVTRNPVQKQPSQQFDTKEPRLRRQTPTAANLGFVFSLLKIRDGRKIEFEVNMRESERERLARRDAYERESERRAKKRKCG